VNVNGLAPVYCNAAPKRRIGVASAPRLAGLLNRRVADGTGSPPVKGLSAASITIPEPAFVNPPLPEIGPLRIVGTTGERWGVRIRPSIVPKSMGFNTVVPTGSSSVPLPSLIVPVPPIWPPVSARAVTCPLLLMVTALPARWFAVGDTGAEKVVSGISVALSRGRKPVDGL